MQSRQFKWAICARKGVCGENSVGAEFADGTFSFVAVFERERRARSNFASRFNCLKARSLQP